MDNIFVIAEFICSYEKSGREKLKKAPSHYARFDTKLFTEKLAKQRFSLVTT
jgi:hypothetical protein